MTSSISFSHTSANWFAGILPWIPDFTASIFDCWRIKKEERELITLPLYSRKCYFQGRVEGGHGVRDIKRFSYRKPEGFVSHSVIFTIALCYLPLFKMQSTLISLSNSENLILSLDLWNYVNILCTPKINRKKPSGIGEGTHKRIYVEIVWAQLYFRWTAELTHVTYENSILAICP